jgi:hypothetical protein
LKVESYRELARDYMFGLRKPSDPETHMEHAVGWLYRAQDQHGDRGVSHSYRLDQGWLPSYPEVTGYIIPSLLNWANATGDAGARERALAMADWEASVQLREGGIPSLMDGDPVVFDTGQVLFGWVSAYRESGNRTYLDCGRRAGDWLLGMMDADGVWRKGGAGRPAPLAYNARTAWAMLELARAGDDDRYAEGVKPFLAWTLEQEAGPGWFAHNCLTDDEHPLLHTIAYTARGQLECGLILGDERLVEAAHRTANAVRARVGGNGGIAGRFDREWQPAVRWACLTGMAQMCLVWSRLPAGGGDPGFEPAARRVLSYLMGTQDVTAGNEGLRGGIKGAFPVNGAYGRYSVLSWATKFFLDALMEWSGRSRPYPY